MTDEERMVIDLAKHSAQAAIASMKLVVETAPPHLRSAVTILGFRALEAAIKATLASDDMKVDTILTEMRKTAFGQFLDRLREGA